MNPRLKNLLLLHVIVFIFGFTGIIGKLTTINAERVVFWRTVIASISLGAFLLVYRKNQLLPAKALARQAFIGLLAAAHWITFFASIKASNVSIALATIASTALFVSLYEPMLLKKKFDWRESFLGLAVIIGLCIIFSVEGEYVLGIVLALISAALAGLFSTLNAIEVRKYSALTISFNEMIFAAIFTALYLVFNGQMNVDLFIMDRYDWLWLILLGTVATAFAFVISVEVLRALSPFTVALTINLEPVYSILIALLLFPETEVMTGWFYLGAAIILGALFVDAYMKKNALNPEEVGSDTVANEP
jgi:drug/metabolite transporter (DMT)-like permease